MVSLIPARRVRERIKDAPLGDTVLNGELSVALSLLLEAWALVRSYRGLVRCLAVGGIYNLVACGYIPVDSLLSNVLGLRWRDAALSDCEICYMDIS